MKKKIVLIAVVAIMAVVAGFVLTACSVNIKIDSFDTITVATNAEFAPFESIVEGEYVGFDMDLIREIGARLGKNVKIDNLDFDAVIAAVSSGTHMVAIAALTINPERKEAVAFSEAYYSDAYQVIIVKENNTEYDGLNKEQIIEKLQGKKINVAKGQVGQAFAQGSDAFGYSGIKNANVKIYDSVTTAALAISGNEVAFADNVVADEFCNANEGYKYINVELTKEYYGIAVAKKNTELLNAINEKFAEMKADGTYDSLYNKYNLGNRHN